MNAQINMDTTCTNKKLRNLPSDDKIQIKLIELILQMFGNYQSQSDLNKDLENLTWATAFKVVLNQHKND